MNTKFRLLKSAAHPLTPELAAEFRDLTPSITERDLQPDRVKHLRTKADAGKLVTFQWAKAKLGDQWFRVNGQHSSIMLCDLNGAFPANLWAHIDEYEVETIEGLVDLFRQMDDRKSARGAGDVAGAFQNLFPDLHDVRKPIGKLTAESITWYRRLVEGVPVKSGDDQYAIFVEEDVRRFVRWLNTVLTSKTREMMKRPVVAAIYATFIANEREATTFWEDVAHGGVEYKEDAPATTLDDWLRKLHERELDKVLPGGIYQGCVYAWNAFISDRQLKAIKVDNKKGWTPPLAA